ETPLTSRTARLMLHPVPGRSLPRSYSRQQTSTSSTCCARQRNGRDSAERPGTVDTTEQGEDEAVASRFSLSTPARLAARGCPIRLLDQVGNLFRLDGTDCAGPRKRAGGVGTTVTVAPSPGGAVAAAFGRVVLFSCIRGHFRALPEGAVDRPALPAELPLEVREII